MIIYPKKIGLKDGTPIIIRPADPDDDVEVISPAETFNLEAGKDLIVHFFVKFPGEITGSTGKESISLTFTDSGKENLIKLEKELKLVGPKSF